MIDNAVLSVRGLEVAFGEKLAVADVSFDVGPGEVLAIVGESGSGKSVTALSIMGLVELSSRGRIVKGEIILQPGSDLAKDLCALSESEYRAIRGKQASMIFQEPLTSLNPVYSVGDQLIEGLCLHEGISRRLARQRAVELLDMVRIPEAGRRMRNYPHQLSGGMRQRVMIAMAISMQPLVLLADEPTTALDVTIQAQILSLLGDLRDEFGTAIVLITHDMAVVAEIADRVVVMQEGRIVESGDVGGIFSRPSHPYTIDLLNAVPILGSMRGRSQPAPFQIGGG